MIYKNEEEMKEKLQEEMKDARNNVRKDRIRITLKRFLTLIIIFSIIIGLLLLRGKYGPLNISSTSLTFLGIDFEKPYSPIYRITINDEATSFRYINDKSYPLIPYFVYFHNIDSSNDDVKNTIKYNSNMMLDISATLCRSKDTKGNYVDACYYSKPIYENVKINIESIKITSNNNIIYNGIFNNNLSTYINNSGIYNIEVVSNYNNVKTTLIFDVEVI